MKKWANFFLIWFHWWIRMNSFLSWVVKWQNCQCCLVLSSKNETRQSSSVLMVACALCVHTVHKRPFDIRRVITKGRTHKIQKTSSRGTWKFEFLNETDSWSLFFEIHQLKFLCWSLSHWAYFNVTPTLYKFCVVSLPPQTFPVFFLTFIIKLSRGSNKFQ